MSKCVSVCDSRWQIAAKVLQMYQGAYTVLNNYVPNYAFWIRTFSVVIVCQTALAPQRRKILEKKVAAFLPKMRSCLHRLRTCNYCMSVVYEPQGSALWCHFRSSFLSKGGVQLHAVHAVLFAITGIYWLSTVGEYLKGTESVKQLILSSGTLVYKV